MQAGSRGHQTGMCIVLVLVLVTTGCNLTKSTDRDPGVIVLTVDDAEAIALAWIDVLDARGPAALPDALDLVEEVTP